MDWKTMLSYISESVDEELLLRSEYLVAENRVLRNQIQGRLRLTDAKRPSAPVLSPFVFLDTTGSDRRALVHTSGIPGVQTKTLGRGSGCFEVSHLLAYWLRYDTKLDSQVDPNSCHRLTKSDPYGTGQAGGCRLLSGDWETPRDHRRIRGKCRCRPARIEVSGRTDSWIRRYRCTLPKDSDKDPKHSSKKDAE